MHISWDDAETFLAIAEEQSFSAGARRLGIGQPTISRRVAQLEKRIGAALFIRGKLGAQLTADGARLLPAAEQMARWAGEFRRLAQGAEETPTGVVRIAAPPGVAVDLLAPLSAQLAESLPDLRLEVLAGIEHLDLTRGQADLAIRTHPPNEPELMTLSSFESEIGVFVSQAYADRLEKRRGAANSIGAIALAELDWVTWAFPYADVAPRPMLERAIPDFEPAFASDNFLVLRAAVVAGMGAMILDRRQVEGTPTAELVELDLGFELPPSAFYLVCAKSMQHVPRIRAVCQRLLADLGGQIDRGTKSVSRTPPTR